MRTGARVRAIGAVVACVGVLASCGGTSEGAPPVATTTTLPAGCKVPPVSLELTAGADGSEAFEVTDAVAQRVPVLPNQIAFTPSDLTALVSKASISPLGLYTIYFADTDLSRGKLSGPGFGELATSKGTVGAVRILPAEPGGFTEGEVVAAGKAAIETRTKQAPLSVAVSVDGEPPALDFRDDVTGTVTVQQISEKTICVDIDVELGDDGGAVKGQILAPIVRSADSFFIN